MNCGDKYIRTEIDFFVNPLGFANDLAKLFYVAQHEIGHGLGLAHVNNIDELMYYDVQPEVYPPVSPNAKKGANTIFDISRSTIFSSCPATENIETLSNATTCVPKPVSKIRAANATVSSPRILVEWENSTMAEEYILERDRTNTFTSPSKQTYTFEPDVLKYTDVSVTLGTTYYYRIKATNSNGSSAYSYTTSATAEVPGGISKPAPERVDAGKVDAETIKIEWDDASSEAGEYIIEKRPVDDLKTEVPFEVIAVLDANTTKYYDWDVEEGQSYEYRIVFITSDGISDYSNSVYATAGTQSEHYLVLPASRSALLIKNANPSYTYQENTNYGHSAYLQTQRWSHGGYPTYRRSLIDFDLSSIPEGAIIEKADLQLFGAGHITNLTKGNPSYKSK